jgi:hypothetical protein
MIMHVRLKPVRVALSEGHGIPVLEPKPQEYFFPVMVLTVVIRGDVEIRIRARLKACRSTKTIAVLAADPHGRG